MPRHFASDRAGRAVIFFGLAAGCIYLLMIQVTLPHLQTLSGHRPFDMRPAGYDRATAAALLEALGPEGRAYYLSRQIPLDMLYPALFALSMVAFFAWLGTRRRAPALARAAAVFAIGAALSDYTENLGIAAMLLSWPELPPGLVQASSLASISKSGLTIAALATVSALVLIRILPIMSTKD